jgi:hypothetical protein
MATKKHKRHKRFCKDADEFEVSLFCDKSDAALRQKVLNEPMSSTDTDIGNRSTGPWRRIGIYAGALLAAFLVGFVPMWWSARSRATERDEARRELRLSQIKNDLSSAVIYSRRGEYEQARQATSNFFTSLRSQCEAADETADLTSSQCATAKPLLDQRDDLITLLARSDPASADRLSALYVSYEKATSN